MGLFARSLGDLALMVEHSLDIAPDMSHNPPRRIIYPTDFFPLRNPQHQQLFESFVQKLEAHLGVQRDEISLARLWEDSLSAESVTASQTLQDYMKRVGRYLLT